MHVQPTVVSPAEYADYMALMRVRHTGFLCMVLSVLVLITSIFSYYVGIVAALAAFLGGLVVYYRAESKDLFLYGVQPCFGGMCGMDPAGEFHVARLFLLFGALLATASFIVSIVATFERDEDDWVIAMRILCAVLSFMLLAASLAAAGTSQAASRRFGLSAALRSPSRANPIEAYPQPVTYVDNRGHVSVSPERTYGHPQTATSMPRHEFYSAAAEPYAEPPQQQQRYAPSYVRRGSRYDTVRTGPAGSEWPSPEPYAYEHVASPQPVHFEHRSTPPFAHTPGVRRLSTYGPHTRDEAHARSAADTPPPPASTVASGGGARAGGKRVMIQSPPRYQYP
jgi:phosphate starvation-inducible membrane PsiE